MCKPTETTNTNTATMLQYPRRDQLRLLLSSKSFHCTDEKGEKGPMAPSRQSTLLTILAVVLALIVNEQLLRYLITTFLTNWHPVFEDERHRHVLARNLGVNFSACFIVALLGFQSRHLLGEVLTFQRKTDDSYHRRMYQYVPQGHRVLVFFVAYQVKNLYDSYVWEDGAIFLAHHVFAGLTAWAGMYPGVASMYGLFFMGLSEVSSCALCLLANFDDTFGVVGLGDAFPMAKVIMGVAFAVLFIVCRIVLWPVFAYHFLSDSFTVLKRNSAQYETKTIKVVLSMMIFSNVGLTALQILWLGEIISTAREFL